jgi:hypothetical protein
MDTQINESFNNTASWLAPKNKVYCGTGSLRNRISIGIGINTIGTLAYFERLYKALGIVVTPNVQHYLKFKDVNRGKRSDKKKTKEAKKERIKRKYEVLKEDEIVARRERSKREGTYRSGMTLEEGAADGYTLEELLQEAATKKPRASSKRTTSKSTATCKHCGKQGHTRKSHNDCDKNPKNFATPTPNVAASAAAAIDYGPVNDAEDADKYDAMPLTNDVPSDASDIENFFDAGTWSDEEGATGML